MHSRVIYNRSGELEWGTITGIVPRKRKPLGFPNGQNDFFVKPDRFPNISKVRYPCSIMVVK